MPLKIAIVDDHPIVAGAMSDMVKTCPVYEVHSVSASLDDFHIAQQQAPADLLLLDVALGDDNSLAHLPELFDRYPLLDVIIFSMFDSAPYIQSAARNGARGFVSKASLHTDLLPAIESVAAGNNFFPESVPLNNSVDISSKLSQREREVLRLAVLGHPTKVMAHELACAPKTVYAHLANITEKLGTRDRLTWRQFALAEGLISPLDRA